ncbi:hypothetical protein PPUJ20066_11350 [Pseudomonas putida]|nr:hypothetical protein PPUJ20066_11350 [Pseudomonas putida]
MISVATAPQFSVPRYPHGSANSAATAHLLVTQGAEKVAVGDLRVGFNCTGTTHLALNDFASLSALKEALVTHLSRSHVGLQLELLGDEAFVWSLHPLGRAAGLEDDEIIVNSISAEGHHQVYCVHCCHLQVTDAAHSLNCHSCGVGLEVRQHFSQRLGAYLGVCANADQPYSKVCQ